MKNHILSFLSSLFTIIVSAQPVTEKDNFIIQQMNNEITNNSHIETLAFELLDEIGPRLVGSPQMIQANEWAVRTMQNWGVEAKNESFGTWKGWQRGTTHVDMILPRVKTLNAMQLAWSPATKKPIEAEVVLFPEIDNERQFKAWLKTIKGKAVLFSPYQKTGRPDHQLKEFASPAVYEKIKAEQEHSQQMFREYVSNTGLSQTEIITEMENAGASAIITSFWSGAMGSNRIFGAKTKKIPSIDIELEDYGLLYRLAAHHKQPKIKIDIQSENLAEAKNFNTIGIIPGKEKPDEYIILSAHLDSWDGAQGATDNGTGVLVMMEAARVLQKFYPNNKRSILIGLWGGEEQGLNGSRAFVKDHPEIIKGTQVVFNLDGGTGKINFINGQGFIHSYDFLRRWIEAAPKPAGENISLDTPGMPSGGGSDHSSFITEGIPAFYLGSVNWDYGSYTWHTNRDTYDKIIFDDLRTNAILIATMTYMASEDQPTNKEKRVLPASENGQLSEWPRSKEPMRSSEKY